MAAPDSDASQPGDQEVALSQATATLEPDGRDAALLREAEEHLAGQRYLRAARCLAGVSDPRVLNARLRRCLDMARDCQEVLDELLEAPLDEENHAAHGWVKQQETHSDRFDAQIFYKVHRDHVRKSSAISCRIESPIDEDLLVPLLSVLNESELYASWMPNWSHPVKLGVQSSEKLREMDRGNQLILVAVDMPFPLQRRECIMHAFAVDDIDDSRAVILKVKSVDADPGADLDDSCSESKVPPVPARGTTRVDFDAGFLVRACPPDHALLRRARHRYAQPLLISVTQRMDAHVGLVPMAMVNFFTKTVIGRLWQALLTVALEVRDGRRPAHAAAIAAKRELYDWIHHRIGVLLGGGLEPEPGTDVRGAVPDDGAEREASPPAS